MFSIYDGRKEFYQWDLNRKLIINDKTIKQVHFANCLCPSAHVCETYEENEKLVVDVPNVLLTEYMDIRVWGYDGGMTKHSATFEVIKKPKPADYIYTETEIYTVEKAVKEEVEKVMGEGILDSDAYANSIINSATGNPIAVNDSSDSPLKGLKLFNKNLLPLNEVTFTGVYYYKLEKPIPAGNYYFSVSEIVTTNPDVGCRIGFYNNGSSVTAIQARPYGTTTTLTLTSDITDIYFYAGPSYSDAVGHTATWKNMMISVDGGAYAPYFGGGDVTVNMMGKNLWTGESTIVATTVNKSGFVYLYDLPKGVPLTVSADITKYPDDTATNTRMLFICYYTDGTEDRGYSVYDYENAERDGVARKKSATITINPNKTVENISCSFMDYSNQSGRNAKAENIQLEIGTTATAYEPYKGQTLVVSVPNGLDNEGFICEDYAELHTYKPITTITNNVGVGMELDYVADTKLYIDNRLNAITQAIISLGGNI